MKTYHVDLEKVRARYDHPGIRYVAMSGIRADVLEERHAKLSMPLGDLHINHVGTAYAGSIFIAIELSAAALFFCTYGVEEWVPIVRSVTVDYLKPTKLELTADLSLTAEEAAEKIAPVEERGRGSYTVEVPLRDVAGTLVASAKVVLYILPFTRELMKGDDKTK